LSKTTNDMLDILSQYWWAFVARGLFAILFVALAFAWPGITSATLMGLFRTFLIIDGVFLLIKAVGNWSAHEDRWPVLLEGILAIGIGLATLLAPRVTLLFLLFYAVAWSLATGVLKIVTAIRMEIEKSHGGWMALSGGASILFGLLLLAFPGATRFWLASVIAGYGLIYGLILVILGFKLRQEHKAKPKNAAQCENKITV
jgi:uncharacterized membrane protein HdeD (DUF308 family)